DLGWLDDATRLSDALRKRLREIETADRGDVQYYVSLAPGVGNPVFDNEVGYPKMEFPDDGYRLLALFRYWNVIQYFYPYKYAIGEDWNGVLDEFLPRFLSASDALQYRLSALELIARIHDTHANLWGDRFLEERKGGYRAAAEVRFVEGKAVVT